MTPTTPPAIPSDILEAARVIQAKMWFAMMKDQKAIDAEVKTIASALLAAQERGKLMERERIAATAELPRWNEGNNHGLCFARAIREGR
jgi:hypothetical protein